MAVATCQPSNATFSKNLKLSFEEVKNGKAGITIQKPQGGWDLNGHLVY
jgi:hypothetical protein